MFESFIASAPPALRNSAKVCELCSFAVFRHLPPPFCAMAFVAEFALPLSYYLVMKKYEDISVLLDHNQSINWHAYLASVWLLFICVQSVLHSTICFSAWHLQNQTNLMDKGNLHWTPVFNIREHGHVDLIHASDRWLCGVTNSRSIYGFLLVNDISYLPLSSIPGDDWRWHRGEDATSGRDPWGLVANKITACYLCFS